MIAESLHSGGRSPVSGSAPMYARSGSAPVYARSGSAPVYARSGSVSNSASGSESTISLIINLN
jgi:hypothetical protein